MTKLTPSQMALAKALRKRRTMSPEEACDVAGSTSPRYRPWPVAASRLVAKGLASYGGGNLHATPLLLTYAPPEKPKRMTVLNDQWGKTVPDPLDKLSSPYFVKTERKKHGQEN